MTTSLPCIFMAWPKPWNVVAVIASVIPVFRQICAAEQLGQIYLRLANTEQPAGRDKT